MKSACDKAAAAIPWYAAGTLPDEQRAAVVSHLESCARCRALLAQAELQLTALDLGALLDGPVDASLLVQYAEEPDSLDPHTRLWIESKLDSEEISRDALARLREVDAAVPANVVQIRPARPIGLWERLSSTVLRPAPAFVYLAAAAVCGALLLNQQRDFSPQGSGGVLLVEPERTARGPNDPPSAAPIEIEAGLSANAAVVLQLMTDLGQDDISANEARYRLSLRSKDTLLWSSERRGAEFLWSPPHAVLGVAIVPAELSRGVLYDLELSAMKPGDPLDGQVLFRRQLIVRKRP